MNLISAEELKNSSPAPEPEYPDALTALRTTIAEVLERSRGGDCATFHIGDVGLREGGFSNLQVEVAFTLVEQELIGLGYVIFQRPNGFSGRGISFGLKPPFAQRVFKQ